MGRKGEEEEDYNMYVRMYINLHLKCINLISSTISSTYSHNEREIEPPHRGLYVRTHICTYVRTYNTIRLTDSFTRRSGIMKQS